MGPVHEAGLVVAGAEFGHAGGGVGVAGGVAPGVVVGGVGAGFLAVGVVGVPVDESAGGAGGGYDRAGAVEQVEQVAGVGVVAVAVAAGDEGAAGVADEPVGVRGAVPWVLRPSWS